MLSMRTTISGDAEAYERAAGKLGDLRPLLKQIGTLMLSQAVERLPRVLKMEEGGVRTGRLAASLLVGDGNNVWELGENTVRVGSNLAYAAQVQFGGPITPVSGKFLAIPLVDQLKRDQLWPRDLDPNREILEFVPSQTGRAPVLMDPENQLGYGTDPLYALVPSVTKGEQPFLYIDEETERTIRDDLYPGFMDAA